MSRAALRDYVGGGIVWDNHACMPLDPHCMEMATLQRCRSAGIDIVSVNVSSGDQSSSDAIRMLAAFRVWVSNHSEEFTLIAKAGDAILAKSQGKLGICFDIEGMSVLDGNLDLVSLYYDLGVRWMLTAYNCGNVAGGGCLDETDAGLTSFGRATIQTMNRVGMVVCGSHAGDRTARELIDASSQPVIFSHSNSRSVWNCPRNIPDEVMVACAARGGVIGLNGIGAFLGPNDIRTETYIAHIEYALDLIGENHVGIALDYCFGEESDMLNLIQIYPALFPPEHGYQRDGLKMITPWRLSEIAESLSARGLKTSTLAKIFGGNHLKIAESVWR